MQALALDDVKGHDGDVMGSERSTSRWKSKILLGLDMLGFLQGDIILSF
jgi:hypothetical protein